jgi:hypothetical protein
MFSLQRLYCYEVNYDRCEDPIKAFAVTWYAYAVKYEAYAVLS